MKTRGKVLIVDDEKAIADTLATILSSAFEVYVAYSGHQALQMAAWGASWR